MNIIRVADRDDRRLADYAGVREPARLRERGLLIAEGRFVVRRLLLEIGGGPCTPPGEIGGGPCTPPRENSRSITLRSLLLNDAALGALGDVLEHAGPSIDIYVASPEVITAATGFNMHRGCLALAERPADLLIDDVISTARYVTVLERVVDADNVGSVFRSAEAFGVEAILLSPGCCDPFYRKAIRTSSGAALMLPWATAAPWPGALDRLRASGFTIAAMTLGDEAIDVGEFVKTAAARNRIALLLGTEGHGLTPDALARVNVQVRIPMTGTLDSLNIATAAGIAMHRLHEVRRSNYQ